MSKAARLVGNARFLFTARGTLAAVRYLWRVKK